MTTSSATPHHQESPLFLYPVTHKKSTVTDINNHQRRKAKYFSLRSSNFQSNLPQNSANPCHPSQRPVQNP